MRGVQLLYTRIYIVYMCLRMREYRVEIRARHICDDVRASEREKLVGRVCEPMIERSRPYGKRWTAFGVLRS